MCQSVSRATQLDSTEVVIFNILWFSSVELPGEGVEGGFAPPPSSSLYSLSILSKNLFQIEISVQNSEHFDIWPPTVLFGSALWFIFWFRLYRHQSTKPEEKGVMCTQCIMQQKLQSLRSNLCEIEKPTYIATSPLPSKWRSHYWMGLSVLRSGGRAGLRLCGALGKNIFVGRGPITHKHRVIA